MSERTALYRMFAADGTLLYIGIAASFGRRWDQHAAAQPWWPEVDHQTVAWLPSRAAAEAAEIDAIHTEHPVHNVVHNNHRTTDELTGLPQLPVSSLPSWPVAQARANLSEITKTVRIKRSMVLIASRGKPQAALVDTELADAAEAVGGADAATEILRKAAGSK